MNDTSRKFQFKVKNLFVEIWLKRLEGDEPVYYMLDKKGDLEGMVSTCVDDFDLAGSKEFVEMKLRKLVLP